jgi:heat shock protein HslJ
MKYMSLRFLCLTLMFLLSGCTTPSATDAPPRATPVPMAVLVRIENQSDFDMEQVQIEYPAKNEERIQISFLAAGETSAYFPLPEIYQSAAIEATLAGQRYQLDAPDLDAESPITTGIYRYVLTFQNEGLHLEFQPEEEGRQAALEPMVKVLAATGAPVVYETSIPRETIFDRLWGESVTAPELLQINQQQVWVYRFAEEETAQQGADAIQVGGTSLTYTRSDGTIAREFVGGLGRQQVWWQWEQFIILLGEFTPPDEATVEVISRALGRDPLHTDILNGSDVQLRLANLSGMDFEQVTMNVGGLETDYGALPQGKVSAYAPQNGAYRYAGITIVAEGQTHEFLPIDFVGETPLSPGNYTYVLEIAEEGISILHLSDDTLINDPALIGNWYWSNSQLPDGTFTTPEGYEGRQPSLQFTDATDPNQAGLSFGGFGGCNSIFGTYFVSPDLQGFATGGVGANAQHCGDTIMSSEALLQEALTGIVYYTVEGDTLILYTPTGTTLTFVRE